MKWKKDLNFYWRMTLWNLARCAPKRWRTEGIEMVTCPKDGRKVLDSISSVNPDVVLLDVFMPNLDALGVIRETQQRNLAKTPQFVTMSSFDNPRLENELMSSGAAYYFLKPFDADYTADRICSLCSESPVPAQLHAARPSIPPSRIWKCW